MFAAAPPLWSLCPGLLFEHAGTLTLPLLHSTERAHDLDQAFITKANYPQPTIVMSEKAVVCFVWRHLAPPRLSVCHCLSHHITETQNSKDTSNYLAMCKYIIKFVTESTHIGSNLEEILAYRICVCAQHNRLGENTRNHDASVVSYLNEVAFCLWRLQIKFCNEISSCEDIRNNLVRGSHDLNPVIFYLNYYYQDPNDILGKHSPAKMCVSTYFSLLWQQDLLV